MFTFIKNWFQKRKEQQIEAYLAKKQREDQQREDQLKTVIAKTIQEQEEALKHSDTPWVKLESAEIHPEYGMQMKLDWNAAFIKHLKTECGFSGTDDEHIIQKYIGALYKEIYESAINENLITSSEKLRE